MQTCYYVYSAHDLSFRRTFFVPFSSVVRMTLDRWIFGRVGFVEFCFLFPLPEFINVHSQHVHRCRRLRYDQRMFIFCVISLGLSPASLTVPVGFAMISVCLFLCCFSESALGFHHHVRTHRYDQRVFFRAVPLGLPLVSITLTVSFAITSVYFLGLFLQARRRLP